MWKPLIIWLHGPTGVGKTRWVHEYWTGEGRAVWTSNGRLEYFMGYNNEPVALLNDYRGCYAPFHQLLLVLDRYPYCANVKHGHATWNPRVICITSSHSPRDVYNVSDTEKTQLIRRLDYIVELREGDGSLDTAIWTKGSWAEFNFRAAEVDWNNDHV